MQTIVIRDRVRHSAVGLTKRKRDELAEVARRWQRARRSYLLKYWDPKYAGEILRSVHSFAHKHGRDHGWSDVDLPEHQARLALESALGLIKSNWRTTIAHVGDLITRNERLTSQERHWLRYVLRSPGRVQDCLRGRTAFVEKPWAEELDEYELSRLLKRLLLRYRAGSPRRTSKLWFQVDTNLYRTVDRTITARHRADTHFKGAWLAISGLRRSHRILVPL